MKKKIISVTRTVFTLAGFNVSITVIVPKDKDPVKVYKYKGENPDEMEISLYLDYPSFINITFPKIDSISYSDLKISIGPRWKPSLERFLEEYLNIFNRDDIFYLENGKLKMYIELPKDAIRVINIGDNTIGIKPTIIEDRLGNLYEGCILTLNKKGIEAPLTHQELQTFKDSIEAIDLFLYSQALLLYVKGILK